MKSSTIIDQQENRAAYLRKMNRQIVEATVRIDELEDISENRHAEKNPQVKKELTDVVGKLDIVRRLFEALESNQEGEWPASSMRVSNAYKELDESLDQLSSKLKRK